MQGIIEDDILRPENEVGDKIFCSIYCQVEDLAKSGHPARSLFIVCCSKLQLLVFVSICHPSFSFIL
jgi:hypothetical protein